MLALLVFEPPDSTRAIYERGRERLIRSRCWLPIPQSPTKAAEFRSVAMDDMQNTRELRLPVAPRRDRILAPNAPTSKTHERRFAWTPDTVPFTRDELREIITNQIG